MDHWGKNGNENARVTPDLFALLSPTAYIGGEVSHSQGFYTGKKVYMTTRLRSSRSQGLYGGKWYHLFLFC